jgi:hypothetical protein
MSRPIDPDDWRQLVEIMRATATIAFLAARYRPN